MRLSRPDLVAFTAGTLYRHSATGEIVEFVGIVHSARREDTEDVGVFRYLGQLGPPLVATRAGYAHGESFEPIHPGDAGALEIGAISPRPSPVGQLDRDDIFGVRRALDVLPDRLWNRFLDRWARLGDLCDYDLYRIRAAALQEADAWRDHEPALAEAWTTISAAMSGYLTWRAGVG